MPTMNDGNQYPFEKKPRPFLPTLKVSIKNNYDKGLAKISPQSTVKNEVQITGSVRKNLSSRIVVIGYKAHKMKSRIFPLQSMRYSDCLQKSRGRNYR